MPLPLRVLTRQRDRVGVTVDRRDAPRPGNLRLSQCVRHQERNASTPSAQVEDPQAVCGCVRPCSDQTRGGRRPRLGLGARDEHRRAHREVERPERLVSWRQHCVAAGRAYLARSSAARFAARAAPWYLVRALPRRRGARRPAGATAAGLRRPSTGPSRWLRPAPAPRARAPHHPRRACARPGRPLGPPLHTPARAVAVSAAPPRPPVRAAPRRVASRVCGGRVRRAQNDDFRPIYA